MAYIDVHHRKTRSPVLTLLVPSCAGVAAAAVVMVGLVTAGISGWAMALSAIPGIAALTVVAVWSLGQRSAERIAATPVPRRPARKERSIRVSFLFGETFDDVLLVDGLADTKPLHPRSPRTPFSLVVRRPRPAVADRALITFVVDCCDNGQDLELVFRGSSRRVLLCSPETTLAVDLAEAARFRLG